jgi:glycosyltransferase involved in cell wall biosynthesis
LIKSFYKNKIDIVFAEYGTTGADMVPICKECRLPLVSIFHGYDATTKWIIEKYKEKYQILFDYASTIIAVSDKMKDRLIEMGCSPSKIIKSTYGPNNLFLDLQPNYSEQKSFVAIGRFVNKKAPYYTILAIRKVVEKYPDFKLYFAGDGELHETIHNLIRYFKLENNIELLGIITPKEFASLLTKVSGFLQHSITALNGDMEGTPVSVLEASGAGIPVIATMHAGIPEVIIDGKTGFLVPEHDVDGMAIQIIKLIENPELVKIMGLLGKNNVSINFPIEKHLMAIKQALEEALNNYEKYNKKTKTKS